MSARRNKIRVLRLFHARLYGKISWPSAEDITWDCMAPVGREFGSPDFERLMQEDFDKQAGVFAPPDLPVQERDSLKGMFIAPPGRTVSVDDMNPWKTSDKRKR